MDCVWKAEKERVPEMAATGSGRKRDSRAQASRWMRCRAWRAKPPKTPRICGVTTCPRHNASWYFACWNVGGESTMEESKRGSVFAKAKVAQKVGRGAQPVGMGLTTLSSKSSWCCVAV
eukprot:4564570-Pleurochrysis_carterae.AAC.1